VLPVVALQVRLHPSNPALYDWGFPSMRSEASAGFPRFAGSSLQLADIDLVEGEDRSLAGAWSVLTFANYARGLGRDYVNGYTPVGHQAFRELFCEEHAGSTCDQARERVFAVEPTTGARYVDLLAVDRLVLQRAQYPGAETWPPPAGWRREAVDDRVVVLERVEDDGRVAGGIVAAAGVTVDAQQVRARSTTARLSAPGGGEVVLARLAWPGFRAALDGRALPVTTVDGVFVRVEVPPGTRDAALEVRYDPPGWRLGAALAALGLVLLAGLVVGERRGRRVSPPTARAP
jgi:hypothetical protein